MTTLPDWTDDGLGSRARVALWLLAEVGEDGLFTKAMLRDAFPGIEQIDRRMRDLRPLGWEIRTNREDPSLRPDELRFLKAGHPAWERGHPAGGITARERAAVLARDGYSCVHCGISAGEPHSGSGFRKARLFVSRRGAGATGVGEYLSECDLCRAGHPQHISVELLRATAMRLSPDQRAAFLAWVELNSDTAGVAGRLWGQYRRAARSVQAALDEILADAS